MKAIHSGNIRDLALKAYGDEKLAEKVENDYLLKESNMKAGN